MSTIAVNATPKGEAWYWRLRRRITPGLLNAQYAYFDQLDRSLGEGERWLDIGCGRRIAPSWMRGAGELERRLIDRADEVMGLDPDLSALADNTLPILKCQGFADTVPEPDASFDLISANMVFEHLDDPAAVLHESYRLLKPGGRLIFHTPNVRYPITLLAACVPCGLKRRVTAWLERRASKDIYPTRYRLNSVATIRSASWQAGLDIDSIGLIADSPETIRLGPLVGIELLLIALTRTALCSGWRSNLVVVLRKPEEATRPYSATKQALHANPMGAAA